MRLFWKKDYSYAFDCLEDFVVNNEVARVTHLLEVQPRLLTRTNSKGLSALHIAALAQKPAMISIILAHGANPNIQTSKQYSFALFGMTMPKGSTPLHFAACVDVARALVIGGASVDIKNTNGETPLNRAEGGWTEDTRQLCEYLRYWGSKK